MAPITMTILLLVGFVAVALCAPAPTLNDSPSNKVNVDDEISQDEREQIVAGIILQIARDFDEGYITQDELEGRSAMRAGDDGVDVARKGKNGSEVQPKVSNDKTPP